MTQLKASLDDLQMMAIRECQLRLLCCKLSCAAAELLVESAELSLEDLLRPDGESGPGHGPDVSFALPLARLSGLDPASGCAAFIGEVGLDIVK